MVPAKETLTGNLYVHQIGYEACEPMHQYGPAVRDHILIHFVASGTGEFWSQYGHHTLRQGEGFVIFPDQITTYRADQIRPWVYYWVGYKGLDAELITRQVGLSRERPVFSFNQIDRMIRLVEGIIRDQAEMRLGALSALGGLYQLLALIGQHQRSETDAQQGYYKKAMWYMEGNYDRPIQITDVADFVGLSRSQLFRVFQKVSDVSPKECLSTIRMNRARMLIGSSTLTLEQIASSVGISSAARLSTLFKETFGMTIGQYRRELNQM